MYLNKKIAFHTLGCKLNFSETSSIARQFLDLGYEKTNFDSNADIYILNTCSVTENANKECKNIIRKVKKRNPNSFVIVTGCFAQLKPKEISKINGVDMVVGASEKFNIPSLLKRENNNENIYGCQINNLNYFSSFSLNDRTRSFLKIQDGCDYPCTYCTIPLARGSNRADTIENIIKNVKEIVKNNIKEIVLTGVNIGLFKDKNNGEGLLELIKYLENIKGIDRYRISSIEPNLITSDIIDFIASSKKFMPHFHIPLQSGSDNILGKMKRRYNTKLYKNKINEIIKKIPNVCIGADVIVGFPGEDDTEFNKTVNFIKELKIAYLHVFTYSERENTEAVNLINVVDKKIRKERSQKLRILSEKLKYNFYKKYIHTDTSVLFEQENKNGYLLGFTKNYIRTKIPFNKDYIKTRQKVRLTGIEKDTLMQAQII